MAQNNGDLAQGIASKEKAVTSHHQLKLNPNVTTQGVDSSSLVHYQHFFLF